MVQSCKTANRGSSDLESAKKPSKPSRQSSGEDATEHGLGSPSFVCSLGKGYQIIFYDETKLVSLKNSNGTESIGRASGKNMKDLELGGSPGEYSFKVDFDDDIYEGSTRKLLSRSASQPFPYELRYKINGESQDPAGCHQAEVSDGGNFRKN